MARQKGMLSLSGNLEVNAGAPLDSRMVVPTFADLTVASNFPYKYIGMPVVVQATGDIYTLTGSDPTDINNWKKAGGDGIALGETSETAYRGDRGKEAYDISQTVGDIADLETTEKGSIVGAINEVRDFDNLSNRPTKEVTGISSILNPLPTPMEHDGNPLGTIISFMGINAPKGYLICDGSTYNIADFSGLAAHFATEFGSNNYFGGDGTATFAVPDLRGEFLRGTGTNAHANQGSGSAVGAHQDGTENPYFGINTTSSYTTWTLTDGHTANGAGIQPNKCDSYIPGVGKTGTTGLGGANNSMKQGVWSSSDTTTNYTSRPTNTSVLYCIKAV